MVVHSPLDSPINRGVKRCFDIVASLLFCIIFLSWIYVIVWIGSKRNIKGSVLFLQERSGRDNKPFCIYKFRTMEEHPGADVIQAAEEDPRCTTAWGQFLRRTCVDEAPQLLNILKGDMSLVGPRPHMVFQTEYYGPLVDGYMDRLQVKPGLSGWAQVNGYRGETPELWMMQERINHDLWYIQHWSLWLDVKIIYMEFAILFKKLFCNL